ncbi:glucose 1-dehydrogenase [Denitratisoma oestradiolicum]|uniref:Cyclopentanol dehydrogenase n=1 Tax=Denitratisoma oestradiolicum TaxID=311182 RepID=A0A6S6Y1I8_9PROT|nr:glucose 1-dehydrogenase [Denitratisoma oestradiolicum]TWO81748.1 3-beta hydroxysteroid dehydrogenase [Denitratisoma oestradiolicum]CAB1370701.1 Cyclopentanol dehydrogenase [Denitratisoma oestradiolicum]
MGRVQGKIALVTGAASGLGEAIALLLAQEGATVAVADIAQQAGLAVVAKIQETGGDAFFVPLDVTRDADWAAAMETVLARKGKLNVLVNNAGIAPSGDMEMNFDLWRKVHAVNLDGAFLGTQHAIRLMRQSGERCSIVNVSSVMAMVAQPTTVAYSASKAGVRGLTKAAAMYCAAEKLPIRVNSVHPETCVTPLVQAYYDSQPPAVLQAQIDRHPIGHLGEALDVAYGVLYLASDESKFVLGNELVIDGGLLASD